ncbi:hypothetical protein BU24DRAFT_149787 [Aaosphaeria arxii CBS 175.79]|uniref:DUF2470 domain-containing protein n=1 Tax=Aaosphaeria arxii CBS 175.79 TaxID=1450172 RepID=A0A6A5XXM9_9PLEO|nr:uncharacterized protein BU24DRAFT_149787 [Aaosphaeria arxii CBS 175.79]KAF2017400.1 hypothetical protein BU24DRAFT_149787 [Aaosphaeria arxii CBS 175.79]
MSTDSKDAAARDRIIKHMNADHHDSVQRYIEVTNTTFFWQLRDAKMTDIDVDGMKFSYSGGSKTATVTFDPPLKSLSEARERLVALDKETMKKLSRSDVTMTTFIPPYVKIGHLINWLVCFSTYALLSTASFLRPGGLPYDLFLHKYPEFTAFLLSARGWIFWIMVAIHGFEAGAMGTRLEQHGVQPDQGIWWAWVATCFVEGITSTWRFNSFIDKKRKEKDAAAKKH